MNITDFIKETLCKKGLPLSEFARNLKIKRQSLNSKTKTNNFTIKELNVFCEMVDLKIVIVNQDDSSISKVLKNEFDKYKIDELVNFASFVNFDVVILNSDHNVAYVFTKT